MRSISCTYISPHGRGYSRDGVEYKALCVEQKAVKCNGRSGRVNQDASTKPEEGERGEREEGGREIGGMEGGRVGGTEEEEGGRMKESLN